ncbi:MAG: sigma-54-dependent Fis family transcriptional regulator [Deltaproteobacteria bacterium]|nr:sigma-54-dependent Fis family transcriptional regulator [Deltaproteobacteria bacterium]
MRPFQETLLQVWRESSRGNGISQALPRLARILSPHLPLGRLLIRRFDGARLTIDTPATAAESTPSSWSDAVTCDSGGASRLVEWFDTGGIVQGDPSAGRERLHTLISPEPEAEFLAAPLARQGEERFFLVVTAAPGKSFTPSHRRLLENVAEPLKAAIDSHLRLRELNQLREAAEADKTTLLAKLSRKAVGDVIVGADAGLRPVMERIERVAAVDIPVLIFGETGTGKELISRTIHNRSHRSHGPFIRVNCGAIPPSLIDSELFGHERGAFTGAVETRKGWFERADGGTLFLDEVGEMPHEAQIRLLRILQDGWMERVGGKQPIQVDVRIVLATHRDLAALVAKGKFREDLWYRISTFPVYLPPLRERPEDLPEMARHFAERSAIRFGLPVLTPTAEDIRRLAAYAWPGNIRELGSVMDRAVLLGEGKRLEIAKSLGWSGSGELPSDPATENTAGREAEPGFERLDTMVRKHIEAALIRTRGRIEGGKGAAVLLGINPHTLRARMRKLGIDWDRFRS